MALEDQLWSIALAEAQAGRSSVLCSVIWGRGSTPREVGARMLLGESGLLAGTVGGGCGESEVLVHARKVVSGFHAGGIVDVDLSGDFDQNEIQACGGEMQVSVERLDPQSDLAKLELLAAAERGEQGALLICKLPASKDDPGKRFVYWLDDAGAMPKPAQSETQSDGVPAELLEQALNGKGAVLHRGEEGDPSWLAAVIGQLEELVIVGSGHVAQPLAAMAKMLSYRVSVIDDRPSYANPERFPQAGCIRVGSHPAMLAEHQPGERSSVVIITRGHQHDEASLRETLKHPVRYVGMIGSRRRAIETLRRLASDGVPEERLSRVHSPIGLDINAHTPEEIALAIMAEVVKARRGGSGVSLRKRLPKI